MREAAPVRNNQLVGQATNKGNRSIIVGRATNNGNTSNMTNEKMVEVLNTVRKHELKLRQLAALGVDLNELTEPVTGTLLTLVLDALSIQAGIPADGKIRDAFCNYLVEQVYGNLDEAFGDWNLRFIVLKGKQLSKQIKPTT